MSTNTGQRVNEKPTSVGIHFAAALCALADNQLDLKQQLTTDQNTLSLRSELIADKAVWVGAYCGDLIEQIPKQMTAFDCRNLRLALTAIQSIEQDIQRYVQKFDLSRLAIIIGTSTSGIADNEPALSQYFAAEEHAAISHKKQEMAGIATALQHYLGWRGIAYTVSTACSSSAKAFADGQRLIQSGIADAVLVGGVDTLCKLTLNGFDSLSSLSEGICRPCGESRDGINIGEAAALFLLSKEDAAVSLIAAGESMDAWHISAPHPEGLGAAKAMQQALDKAKLSAADIGYLNLHGTATEQNDAMEIKAVDRTFGDHKLAMSSTKHKTGHCLGAAAAIEAFICLQILSDQSWLPLHHSAPIDPALAHHHYVRDYKRQQPLDYVMSNSFAFGGSNVSLIFGREKS